MGTLNGKNAALPGLPGTARQQQHRRLLRHAARREFSAPKYAKIAIYVVMTLAFGWIVHSWMTLSHKMAASPGEVRHGAAPRIEPKRREGKNKVRRKTAKDGAGRRNRVIEDVGERAGSQPTEDAIATDSPVTTTTDDANANPLIVTTKSDTTPATCACDLVSVDCLDSVDCIPGRTTSLRRVAKGILQRILMRKTAKFVGEAFVYEGVPVGKGLQYKAIDAWLTWTKRNQLPLQHNPVPNYIFVNASRYELCVEKKLVGLHCYFTSLYEEEEYSSLEEEARPYLDKISRNGETKQYMMRKMRDLQVAVMNKGENEIHALDHLLSMAHVLRMLFNRQEALRELSTRVLTYNANEGSQKDSVAPLRVSLHLRRADACMADGRLVDKASPLDSSAQQFALRICYATSVYMDALRRLRDLVTKKDIEVFVSSDDAGSLVTEIRDQFPELYGSMTWHIHDVDRERFNYKGFVEGQDHSNHDLLGESAVADLWLLSNGEVFIGHLGSRFGKVAYLLATARHNRFIPFFSVDGHSFCCEVDEPCGEMKPYIRSMTDCLTFAHDRVNGEMNKDYFDVGSYMRRIVAEGRLGGESHAVKDAVEADRNDEEQGGEQEPKASDADEDVNPWADLTAPIADYAYFPETGRKQSVTEPAIELDQSKCSSLALDTSPPKKRPPSNGACDGFDGVLHIHQGDTGGASGTIFFLFVLGMLQYAEQHNLKPWVHLNSWSRVVYDPEVHGQGGSTKFNMMGGMEAGWARDARDPEGNLFPGKPLLRQDQNQLQHEEFSVDGTGVWEHYFLPVSDFSPGDPSCVDKPLIVMDNDHITPGIHSQSPWAPRAWRVSFIEYIEQRDLDFDIWIEPKRRNATKLVNNYIRFNQDMQQRAECAHPTQENSLGLHIRHSDKGVSRGGVIPLSEFFPYAKAFVENGGGSIFVATDSSLVIEEITTKWPEDVRSHVVHQEGVTLSRDDTATFDMGASPHRTNVEALTDALALSKCTYLVHGFSALSEAAIYLNPSLIERSVNLEHNDQDGKTKFANFLKMIS